MRVDNGARSGGIIRISLIFYNMKVSCVFSLESPHWGDSNENTQYTVFNIKKKITWNFPNLPLRDYFQGTQERVRNSRGKRAISVRAIEVLLYCDLSSEPSHWDSSIEGSQHMFLLRNKKNYLWIILSILSYLELCHLKHFVLRWAKNWTGLCGGTIMTTYNTYHLLHVSDHDHVGMQIFQAN